MLSGNTEVGQMLKLEMHAAFLPEISSLDSNTIYSFNCVRVGYKSP